MLNHFSPGQWMWTCKLMPHYRWTSQTLWARETRSSLPSTPRYTTSMNKNYQDCVFVISAHPPKCAWPSAHAVCCIHSLNDFFFPRALYLISNRMNFLWSDSMKNLSGSTTRLWKTKNTQVILWVPSSVLHIIIFAWSVMYWSRSQASNSFICFPPDVCLNCLVQTRF